MFDGRLNRRLGWAMLTAAFAAAIGLDPWSLSEHDSAAVVSSPRMFARHGQAVVVGMAIMQLAAAEVLRVIPVVSWVRVAVSGMCGLGAALHALGYVLYPWGASWAWLAAIGASLNGGAAVLLYVAIRRLNVALELKALLPIFCLGMFLDAGMALFAAEPALLRPDWIGAEDGLRLRLLRLARAAVIALSALALNLVGLTVLVQRPTPPQPPSLQGRGEPESPSPLGEGLGRGGLGRIAWWGRVLLLVGAFGMPLVLVTAAFGSLDLKYLLPVPAQAVFWGTLAGIWLAGPPALRLERWGWCLCAASMGAGLLMGLYAFDGPLPAPEVLGEYNDFGRRVSRLIHAYAMVLGLASIFLARDLSRTPQAHFALRLGVPLFVSGSVIALLGLTLTWALPTWAFAIGPAFITLGLVTCVASTWENPS